MDIELRDEPTRLVAVHRETVRMDELPGFYDRAYRSVVAAVQAAGGTLVGPAIGWYRGMPTDTTDVSAGFPVAGLDEGEVVDGVVVEPLPGGRVAAGLHVGPYDGLRDAWMSLEDWRRAHGVTPRGDFWEVYLTDPSPDGDPGLNETLVVLPLV
ncbi:GyrI-like domain-containing protein [Cellulomonas sp. HZM]|uniref:GyrI-like domain-containing protein n=1 Tax=Cellulomonas sp. HZM TaxID=1454010 RepID=UPI000493038B|nr:GyrI-like domain-containing protein [Cellulomonas sp. HZM]